MPTGLGREVMECRVRICRWGEVRAYGTMAGPSALSGCGWALIAYLIGHEALGNRIWGGIIASPMIGVLIGHLSRPVEAKLRRVQVVAALFDLYLAAACFAVAMAAFDPRNMASPAVLIQHVISVWWGLTFTGYFLALWPLSLFNHRLVWHADAARRADPPQVSITFTTIRNVAVKIVLLAMLGYVASAVLQVILMYVRSSKASAMPWWVTTDLMGWSNWCVFGGLIWVTAPILASAATRAAGSEKPLTTTYGDLIGLVGFTVFAFPIFSFAATWIVTVVKVSLVHSWATEGAVFWASCYYRNVFQMYLPWFVIGSVLTAVRRLISRR
jgi:hypothetical protein